MKEEKDPDELVEYFIINTELKKLNGDPVSQQKIGVQMAHVATLVADRMMWAGIGSHFTSEEYLRYQKWLHGGEREQKKIVLAGKTKDLEKLAAQGFINIRDKGYTELPPNTLTCVCLGIMTRREAEPFIKRLQLYKEKGEKP